MKRRWLIIGFAGCAWSSATAAFGAEPSLPASVRVDVQMVSVSVADALLLVPGLQNAKTAQGTFDRVQEMIAQDKAVLLGWPMVWLLCGQSGADKEPYAVSEGILEVRSPTDLDLRMGGAPPVVEPSVHWGAFTPTMFETRNTQAALTVGATVEENGRIIALDLLPVFCRLLDFREYRIPPAPSGSSGVRVAPNFGTSQTSTTMRVVHDRPTLLSAFVWQKPEPHVELFILRARATVLPREAKTAIAVPSLP